GRGREGDRVESEARAGERDRAVADIAVEPAVAAGEEEAVAAGQPLRQPRLDQLARDGHLLIGEEAGRGRQLAHGVRVARRRLLTEGRTRSLVAVRNEQ